MIEIALCAILVLWHLDNQSQTHLHQQANTAERSQYGHRRFHHGGTQSVVQQMTAPNYRSLLCRGVGLKYPGNQRIQSSHELLPRASQSCQLICSCSMVDVGEKLLPSSEHRPFSPQFQ